MGAFVDDSADFFEHGAEVLAAVGAEGSGDVLPHKVSRSNFICSSILASPSHLLDYSDLLHKQPGAGSVQPCTFPSDGKILTGASADYNVDERGGGSVYFRYVAEMYHLPILRHGSGS